MENRKKLENPHDKYYHEEFPIQHQTEPGLQSEMTPVPDCGEKTYKGSGKLQGRKALITGADSGIGRATAIAYSREGADIVINYYPTEQQDAEQVAELLQAEGRTVIMMPGDLRDEEFCKKLVRDAHQALGGLDTIALVAGRQKAVADIAELKTEEILETFEVNVFSMYYMLREAVPHMPEGSSIVLTTSIQSYQPSEDLLDYAATKAAIMAFSRALAKQVAKKGIRVNAVAPGPIWTPLQICGGQLDKNIPDFGKSTPLGRAGQPAELAGVYVFLASDDASYVTAEVYGVTGGNHTF